MSQRIVYQNSSVFLAQYSDLRLIFFNSICLLRKAKELETTIKERTYDFAGEAVTVKEEIRNKRRSLASTLGLDRYHLHYTYIVFVNET